MATVAASLERWTEDEMSPEADRASRGMRSMIDQPGLRDKGTV